MAKKKAKQEVYGPEPIYPIKTWRFTEDMEELVINYGPKMGRTTVRMIKPEDKGTDEQDIANLERVLNSFGYRLVRENPDGPLFPNCARRRALEGRA